MSSKKNLVLLDGYNLFYRARYASRRSHQSEHGIAYNFFRSLRVIAEKFQPSRCILVLEGFPKSRLQLFPEYKKTRIREDSDNFIEKRRQIIDILSYFPIDIYKHQNFEADDLIAHFVGEMQDFDRVVVVSSDTDFIQLYNRFDNFSLYNPVTKKFRTSPEVDYIKFKSLIGDSSDNIPGFRGIGKKRATKMLANKDLLYRFLDSKEKENIFERNQKLIKFEKISDIENIELLSHESCWKKVHEKFEEMEFWSIVNEKSWNKYIQSFTGGSPT